MLTTQPLYSGVPLYSTGTTFQYYRRPWDFFFHLVALSLFFFQIQVLGAVLRLLGSNHCEEEAAETLYSYMRRGTPTAAGVVRPPGVLTTSGATLLV